MTDGRSSVESQNKQHKNIEVWEDLVNIRDLILSLLICSITTLGGYLVAPNDASKPLIFGLIGAVVGFILCSILFKPKRTFEYIDEDEEN